MNEQRLSYWIAIFEQNNYQVCDAIRGEIWNDKKIPVWYRNNTVIFYNKLNPLINAKDITPIVDIVNPDMFEGWINSLSLKGKLVRLISKIINRN